MTRAVITAALFLGVAGCLESPNAGPDIYCLDASWCADNAGYPRCDTALHRCVAEAVQMTVACTGDSGCADPAAPVCDSTSHTCRACRGKSDDAGCAAHGASTPRCLPETGRCGACRADTAATDCGRPERPVCEGGVCRGCRAPAECTSLVCQADGSCAPAADVAYVDNMRCKQGTRTGSRMSPFCEISEAVAQLGDKKVIRVEGSMAPYHGVTTAGTLAPVRIVGPGRSAQPPATLTDNEKPCLEAAPDTQLHAEGLVLLGCKGGLFGRQATVTLRGCAIRESLGPAVELRDSHRPTLLDGNVIADNGVGGGLSLYGIGAFDIRNNFIANNRNGNVGQTGGVYLDQGCDGRFAFNTLRNNGSNEVAGGIACEGHPDNTKLLFESSILLENSIDPGGHQFGPKCLPNEVIVGIGPERWTTGIRKLVNPEWTSTMLDYRLLPAPHNPDILDAVLPGDNDHDIDGNPRPAGMPADIGCFEVR